MSADYPPPVQSAIPPLRDEQRESEGPKARGSEGDPQGNYPTNGGPCQKPPPPEYPPLAASGSNFWPRPWALDDGADDQNCPKWERRSRAEGARTMGRGGRVTPPARNQLAADTDQKVGGR